MHIYDESDKSVKQVFPAPDDMVDSLQYKNLSDKQKINVIKYMFNLKHGKGKRKKKRRS